MSLEFSVLNDRSGEIAAGHAGANGTTRLHDTEPANSTAKAEQFAAAVRLLWKGRGAVILIASVVVAGAIAYSLWTPARYESSTRLLPSPPSTLLNGTTQMTRPDIGALAGFAGLPNLHTDNERFVALLKSRVVADRIIDRFRLMKLYGARYRHEARTALAQRTVVQQDRKTGIITITVTDHNPILAMHIAQAYVDELEKFNAEMNTSGAHMERVFLEGRVKEVDQQLQEAVARLSEFSTNSGMLDPQTQPKSTVDEALKLETQIVTLKAQLSGEEQIYQPAMLKVAEARLAELERHLAELQGTHGDSTLPSIHSLPKLSATFADYARRAKLLEAIQLYLTQKLELAKTDEVKQLPVFRVMEPAEIPEQRVWPRRTFIVLTSAVFGLLAGMVFVLGYAKWRETDVSHPIKALLRDLNPITSGRKAG